MKTDRMVGSDDCLGRRTMDAPFFLQLAMIIIIIIMIIIYTPVMITIIIIIMIMIIDTGTRHPVVKSGSRQIATSPVIGTVTVTVIVIVIVLVT